MTERTGGWRSTGPLARIALFLLGLVAAALLLGILGFRDETTLLIAGFGAALAAEWLTVERRLHASGVEEGLCVAGFLMIGAWITTLIAPPSGFAGGNVEALVLIAAVGAAGLRLLNPLVTTCAVIGLVYWVESTSTARALDQTIGGGLTTVIVGCALALLALVLGAREYRRPSHDRMLDWLVATLPVAGYAHPATWNAYGALHVPGGGVGPTGHLRCVDRPWRRVVDHRPSPATARADPGLPGLCRLSCGGVASCHCACDRDLAHRLRARSAGCRCGVGPLLAPAARWNHVGGAVQRAKVRWTCCRQLARPRSRNARSATPRTRMPP
ncbi:MAG: hypothetical protein IPJ97_09645 [Proteobacteria bacterium]|nr:hypothetical protein [Pseudomonadota bacterium]